VDFSFFARDARRKMCIAGLSCFFLGAIGIFISNHYLFAWAAGVILLGDKHKNAGIVCEGCHKKDLSEGKVIMAICLHCHGDYNQLGEQTKNMTPNPHASHLGNLECGSCHHAHKRSEDYCGQCHYFGFKVP
jgi:hypothetical protein